MNAPLRITVRWLPSLFWLLVGLGLWLAFTPTARAQTCDIAVSPSAPVSSQAFSLCGPAGTDLTYAWYDSTGPIGDQSCLAYAGGLPAGTYDWTLIVGSSTGMSICPYELVIAQAPPQAPIACLITVQPQGSLCGGQAFSLCAPSGDGLTYAWFDGAGNPLGTDRCLSLTAGRPPGRWDFSVAIGQGATSTRCSESVVVGDCPHVLNCPRGAGFWAQACERRGRALPQLTADQMSAIASASDARSSFFDWSASAASTNGASMCSALNPLRPMDARKQAKRQFAALLANVSAGALAIHTRHGEPISLDPATAISCAASPAATIGELVADVDGLLSQLEAQPLGAAGVVSSYESLTECLEAVNEGLGIGPVCSGDAPQAGDAVLATPNPFSVATQLEYEVAAGGEPVDIGVYDVTGRLVQKLATGWQPAGVYQVRWDGRNASGFAERSGVFFVRGTMGDRPIAARLLLLR